MLPIFFWRYYCVELAIFGKGRDETNAYGGWGASMKVNGKNAWRFIRYDNKEGGRIRNYIENREVWEKSGKGKWLNITSLVKAGQNYITYAHNTGGPGIGVKIRITFSKK